jgi:LytS/YehU family sensor histidine kinase
VQNYIGIEQVRFGDKLKAGFQMDESSLSLMIPSFILHPLVENAIKYGMETSPMPLQVTIHSEYDGKRLTLAVTNSGKWVPGNSEIMGTGTGLQNVRDRLAVTYQSKHRFGIDKEDGKVTVRMVIEQINYGQKNYSADRG